MNLSDLRKELSARNLNLKGIKSQLAARLGKYLKTEAEDECEGAEKASKLLQAAQDIDLAEKEIKADNLKVCILDFNIFRCLFVPATAPTLEAQFPPIPILFR